MNITLIAYEWHLLLKKNPLINNDFIKEFIFQLKDTFLLSFISN